MPGESTPTMTWVERAGLAVVLSLLAFGLLAMVGFGTKTSCTSTMSNDCGAIDLWAWGAFIASSGVALLSALLTSSRRWAARAASLAGAIVLAGCVAMLMVGQQ